MTTNVGSTTTYFVGTHYEVENGVITKYYYAGTQRIAMRKNGTLTYILSDHLGSTSMITDSSGNVISETKYKAWGETRYSSGTNPTDYTYTGQYSYTNDFGLMFYNARWYDPSLGRFAQADTIVPSGSQGLDRYAYTFNNPINYVDPSGHVPVDCYGTDYCGASNSNLFSNGTRATYGNGLIGPALPPDWEPPSYGNGIIGPPLPSDWSPPTYGDGLIGPPAPPAPLACFRNTVCMDTPVMDLHPFDILNPPIIGISLTYSETGQVTGYQYITAVTDYQKYTLHPEIFNPKYFLKQFIENASINLMEENLEMLGKVTAIAGLKKINAALFTIDMAQTGNQFITFESTGINISPVIPVRNTHPISLQNLLNPFAGIR